jgi:hypothetical protein
LREKLSVCITIYYYVEHVFDSAKARANLSSG